MLYYSFLHAMKTGDIVCELYEPSTSKEFRAEVIIDKWKYEGYYYLYFMILLDT